MQVRSRKPASGGPQPGPLQKRRTAYLLELRAETLESLRLQLAGWRILDRRFLAAGGEIDIVAARGSCVAFVEVKPRATRDAAAASITPDKTRRMRRARRRRFRRAPALAHARPQHLRSCRMMRGAGVRLAQPRAMDALVPK